ncbi:MAG: DNA primase [Candidatus Pacebacteria bacterium]|nr:DNA primase [Candidatus Paceibacterota bacterium]
MSSSNVERIKQRLDIVDVIGSYVKLDKAGRNYKAKSPFTNEKTPSFYVSPERQLFYCFSSNKGGDIFTFVEEMEGVDFRGAMKILAERAGIILEYEDPKKMDERDRLYKLMELAKEFYQSNLNEESIDYLKGRGITEKTIKEWSLGYSPNDWRVLKEYLLSKKIPETLIKKAGLIKETGYDTFRDRITFPIFDASGRVVAFSGRILHPNDKAPKYLNSPDTLLFKKSDILYGLHKAKTSIRRKDYSVLVEGQMDLVLSHQAGIDNTIASSGTAITESHIRRIKQLSNRIIISFDSDEAGFKAANRTAKLGLSSGMEVKVVVLPDGKDPADLINESIDKWRDALKNSRHIIDFYIDKLLEKVKDKRNLAKEISKNVLPYISWLSSDIEKSHFVARIVKETGFREDAIWEDLKKIEHQKEPEKESESHLSKESPEERISAIYHWQNSLKDPLIDIKDFEKGLKEAGGEELLERIKKRSAQEFNKVLFEIEKYYGTKDILKKDLVELFKNLKIHILSKKKEELKPLIQKEDEGAIKEFDKLSREIIQLKEQK